MDGSAAVLWVGRLQRQNGDEDAENNVRNDLVAAVQAGKARLVSQTRYLGQRLTYFRASWCAYQELGD